MTLENLKKQHARLIWLASGEFTERDFDYKIKATVNPHGEKGEGGWSSMGEMSSDRKRLIQEDAQETLKIFLRKYPEFEEVKSDVEYFSLAPEVMPEVKQKPKSTEKK